MELHKTAAKNNRVHASLFDPLVTTSPAIHRILDGLGAEDDAVEEEGGDDVVR